MEKDLDIIDEVFISTDSDEIANIGLSYGAKVINRPSYLSQDNSPEWEAWRHAIETIKDQFGDFDIFISLPATTPLREIGDVKLCLSEFINSQKYSDILITVMPSKKSPWFNMVKIDDNGYTTLLNPGGNYTSRQQVPKRFEISTLAYVTTPSYINKESNIWAGKVKSIVFPYEKALDIDDQFDYEMACHIWVRKIKYYE